MNATGIEGTMPASVEQPFEAEGYLLRVPSPIGWERLFEMCTVMTANRQMTTRKKAAR